MSAADPAERPRSHTLERLFAACAVMAACLTGGIGLSAISRNFLEQRAPAENAMLESASPPAAAAQAVQAGRLQAEQLRAEQLQAQELAAQRARDMEEAARLRSELEVQVARVRRLEELQRQQAQAAGAAQSAPASFDPQASPPPPIPVSAGSASPPPVLAAGGEVNFNASPTYGTVSLSSGFTPDPYFTQLSAGGGIDASAVGASCRGFVASNPDLRVNYRAGAVSLYVFVESDADTTLVVNAPDGSWHCAAAAPGRGPLLAFEHPQSGQYDIWVGAHSATVLSPAILRISEIGGQ